MPSSYKLNWPILGQPPRVQISIPSRRRITAFKNFLFFCRLKTTTEKPVTTNVPLKNIENWKKSTNAWVLDSPPTSKAKFKTLKKSIQYYLSRLRVAIPSVRLGWNGGEARISFSASNCNEWRGTTSSLQRRKCYKSSTTSWLGLHFLSSSKKPDP